MPLQVGHNVLVLLALLGQMGRVKQVGCNVLAHLLGILGAFGCEAKVERAANETSGEMCRKDIHHSPSVHAWLTEEVFLRNQESGEQRNHSVRLKAL